jgi:undecaprenyl-diphosphatase
MTIMDPVRDPARADRPPGWLNDTVHWLRRHTRPPRGALVVLVALGVLGAAFAALIFAALAALVTLGVTQGPDEAALRWVAARRTPALDWVMAEVTTLGNTTVMAMVACIAALFLWAAGHRRSVLLLWLTAGAGVIANSLLKAYFDRARPDVIEALAQVMSTSFPSGHAMNSLIVYGSVAFVVAQLEPTRTLQRLTWAVAALLVLTIGVSRVYLGVHYPSDVVAGFAAGAGWLVLLPVASAVLDRLRPARSG